MKTQQKTIFCHYFKEHLPALPLPPIGGELGILIQQKISQKAWQKWLIEQVKLINENTLSLNKIEDRTLIKEKMMKFLQL